MAIHPEPIGDRFPGLVYNRAPRNVYWETTQACDLSCQHCRANAQSNRLAGELSTTEGKALIDSVRELGSLLILTGGDPMKRDDLFELMTYARSQGVAIAITPSTTPSLTEDVVREFSKIGIVALGLSLDGPTREVHDEFRKVAGTFERAKEALNWAREYNLTVQINTTVTTTTLPHIPEMYRLLSEEYAPPVRRWSLFQLIPVGRGLRLNVPTPNQINELFGWLYEKSLEAPFHIGTVEAPHYRRYWIERKLQEGTDEQALAKMAGRMGFGIRDGNGVIFVSHLGEVHPAGFLPHPLLGNVKERPLHDIYRNSKALAQLRNPDAFKGRCGRCEYRFACGGSRARAYAVHGDMMAEDPLCTYEPRDSD